METQKQAAAAAVDAYKQGSQDKRNEMEAEVQEDRDTASTSLGSTGTAA